MKKEKIISCAGSESSRASIVYEHNAYDYTCLSIITFLIMTGCSAEVPETTEAMKIVEKYYTALNEKNYQVMYSLISEGFKHIEPTAKSYDLFATYMNKFYDTSESIRLTKTTGTSASADKVVVDYVAEIVLKNGVIKELKSSFTVKKKPEGWKLIHPYGQNIDTS